MSSSTRRPALRAGVLSTVTAAVLLAAATPALAHVTAQPGQAEQGGYAVISLRVPTESDTAGTVKLQVTLPADHPISSVRTTPARGLDRDPQQGPAEPADRTQRPHDHRGGQHRHVDRRPGHPDRAGRVRRLPAVAGPAARGRPTAAAGRADLRRRRGRRLGPAARRRRLRARAAGALGHAGPGRQRARRPAAQPPAAARADPGPSSRPTHRPLAGRRRPAGRRARPRRRGRRPCCAAAAVGGRDR